MIDVGLFLVGAVVVWLAGRRLTGYADTVSARTRLSHALIGALMLGGITSLPELATTSTAALSGNAELAVNNIFGGVAMQVAILAIADALIGERGLSTLAGASSLMLQGNGLMVALGVAAAGMVSGSVVFLGLDLWTVALLAVVITILASIQRYEQHPHWRPDSDDEVAPEDGGQQDEADEEAIPGISNRRLVLATIVAGLLVIAAGYLVTVAADSIAEQTGLGASFMGAVLLAGATSLPEVSTTLEAVRLGRHRLAFSNIFGTNLFDVALLFVADLLYREGAVLDVVGDFAVFGAMLGLALTGVYVAGILQRRERVVFRMGLDSAVVLVLYAGGVAILYSLR